MLAQRTCSTSPGITRWPRTLTSVSLRPTSTRWPWKSLKAITRNGTGVAGAAAGGTAVTAVMGVTAVTAGGAGGGVPQAASAARATADQARRLGRKWAVMGVYPRCAEHPLAYKDAVVLSPHKFVGGPGTPGVLVIRRELLKNRVPDVVGGGTVAYVNPTEHRCCPPTAG